MLTPAFFQQDAQALAKNLLGKVIRSKYQDIWLSAQITETEAYYMAEKSSHSSQGFTEKRKAMFMPAGTIYMYYSRGADSMNISCQGEGNAVLIKAGMPYIEAESSQAMIAHMHQLNPGSKGDRPVKKLCAGQTLLCKALNLTVKEWDQQQFDAEKLYIEDVSYQPKKIVQARRMGIPAGRDEHLMYRFLDFDFLDSVTESPLRKRKLVEGEDYLIHVVKA